MKPAPTLSTAFLHPAGQSLPEPLLALRKQRGTALVDMPLPTRKTENWKYSSKYLKLTDDMAISLPADGKTGSGLAVRRLYRAPLLPLTASARRVVPCAAW